MLTSTLTRHFDPFRPVTFSPTSSCEAKVYFQDTVDIASVATPKPRVITLEPISRLKRVKTGTRIRPSPSENTATSPGADSLDPPRNATLSELGSTEESDGPGSPAPSQTSFDSRISSGNASGTEYGIRSVHTAVDDSHRASDASNSSLESRTITASVEILKGGFLRGDQIPLKIFVRHTKHVRSFRGIIVTLYRQARVDMNPALPLHSTIKGGKNEEYYPKSKTGLGGLSLSSAGSSHVFRKDLAQTFAPLFVDPRTLIAETKCAVRIPEEAFPTLSKVPGAMISFRYFVEVVVDIQGRLVRLDRMLPEAAAMLGPSAAGSSNVFSAYGTFLDTDAIRREKGVVTSLFEVVVGTRDSDRIGKQRMPEPEPEPAEDDGTGADAAYDGGAHAEHGYGYFEHNYGEDGYYDYGESSGHYYGHYSQDSGYGDIHDHTPAYYGPNEGRQFHQPAAEWASEEGLTEKERIRRAEARLLPSQPPGDEAGPSVAPPDTAHAEFAPSAPYLPEEDDVRPYSPTIRPPSSPTSPMSILPPLSSPVTPTPPTTASGTHTRTNGSTSTINANPAATSYRPVTTSPAPEYAPPPSSSSHIPPTEDKQELQRRRLMMERSAPPGSDDLDHEDSSAPPTEQLGSMSIAPSAPVLEEEDEGLVGPVESTSAPQDHLTHKPRKPSEDLPVYQR